MGGGARELEGICANLAVIWRRLAREAVYGAAALGAARALPLLRAHPRQTSTPWRVEVSRQLSHTPPALPLHPLDTWYNAPAFCACMLDARYYVPAVGGGRYLDVTATLVRSGGGEEGQGRPSSGYSSPLSCEEMKATWMLVFPSANRRRKETRRLAACGVREGWGRGAGLAEGTMCLGLCLGVASAKARKASR